MKTTQRNFKVATLAHLTRWAVFAVTLASVLALVAVATGTFDGKLVKLAPSVNEAWQYYANAGNADMSVIFDVR
jgi:hypothetical protein